MSARRFLPVLYLLTLVAVFATAVALWRTYCEGFGCTGLGIAWAMWAAVLYAPALILGMVARSCSSAQASLRALVPRALIAQVLVGVCLVGYWAFTAMPGAGG